MTVTPKNTAGKTVVVGLGQSGLSALTHLRAHGIAVCAVDSRAEPPGLDAVRHNLPDVDVHLGPFDADFLSEAVELVVSPGVSLDEPAVAAARENGVPTYGDIELFARVARAPVVAITGSNGKSTVTTLAGEMMRADGRVVGVGGNLGPPALDLLPSPSWVRGEVSVDPAAYVLELSSFQLETTHNLRPDVAVLLNISPDHMDRYPNFDAYVDAKLRVFEGASHAVINRDDTRVAIAGDALAQRNVDVLCCTSAAPGRDEYGLMDIDGEVWLCAPSSAAPVPVVKASELHLVGEHNQLNALMALAICDALGIDRAASVAGLTRFRGLAHRCEVVSDFGGVRWVNDSKGTNVGATMAAVEGLSQLGPVVLIAGGDGKGADFTPLADALRGRARAVVLLGRDGPAVGAALQGVVPLLNARDMDHAVRLALDVAKTGDVVVLSPACASWDMYENYTVRGEHFINAVRTLAQGEAR